MNVSILFRKCVSVFVFVVFALGITPLNFLHDAVANHTDVCYHNFSNNGKQISKADVNCKLILFVAEAQFINGYKPFVCSKMAQIKNSPLPFFTEHFFSHHHFYCELRGPPFVS